VLTITVGSLVSGDVVSRSRRDDGETVRVTTILEEPYVIEVTEGNPEGNARFKGYIPDLLEKIFSRLNRDYTMVLVADNNYGVKNEDNTWNGMIGELIDESADMAAGPITIYPAREEAVDFTDPYMDFGTTIMIKKPADGADPPVNNAEELAGQSEIAYGAVRHGSTQDFFKNSEDQTYRTMWTYMTNHPDDQVGSVADGVQKVRDSNGRYAFIMESSSADFWTNKKPCDLMTVGGRLGDDYHYGLATRNGDALRDQLNDALNHFKQNQELEALRNKWWNPDENGCGTTGSAHHVTSHVTLLALLSLLGVMLALY